MDTELGTTPAACGSRQNVGEIDRSRVASRLGVDGDFMRIPQLSRALGVSANAIYWQMRLGTFPIAHRRVGNLVVVKLDDYIAWLNAENLPTEPTTPRRRTSASDKNVKATQTGPAAPPPGETKRERSARTKREIRESMRRKGLLG